MGTVTRIEQCRKYKKVYISASYEGKLTEFGCSGPDSKERHYVGEKVEFVPYSGKNKKIAYIKGESRDLVLFGTFTLIGVLCLILFAMVR